MLLSDIITHTRSVLPLFSDGFSDTLSISSVTKSGDTVSVACVGSNVTVGDDVLIAGVKTSVVISDITTLNGIATATCSTNHDLTLGYTLEIRIVSPEASYSNTFSVLSVPSANEFTFNVDGSPPSSTGELRTFHNSGFNGFHEVTNVIDTDNFEYTINNDALLAGVGNDMELAKKFRISGAATLEVADNSYTEKGAGKLWGYFVFDPATVDQNRSSRNGAVNELTKISEMRLRIINNISFHVYIPTDNQISARKAIDNAHSLLIPIYKTLVGYLPPTLFSMSTDTVLLPTGHFLQEYSSAFLVYTYQFQYTESLTNFGKDKVKKLSDGIVFGVTEPEFMANTGDTLPNFDTSAFKLFNSKVNNSFDEVVKDDDFEVQN